MQEYQFHPRGRLASERCRVLLQEDGDTQRVRSLARQHWGSRLDVPGPLRQVAARIQQSVHSRSKYWHLLLDNNVANVRPEEDGQPDWEAHRHKHHAQQLLDNLDVSKEHADVGQALWLACHEVGYHLDEGSGEDAAFLVWLVAGPAKALEFPALGFGLVMELGDAVLFDGMQPHGVALPEHAAQSFRSARAESSAVRTAADVSVFLSLDLALSPALQQRLLVSTTSSLVGKRTRGIAVNEVTGRARFG